MKSLSVTSSRTVNRQKKWCVINDTRNTTVSNNNIFSLKNSFGEFLFDNKQIVNLLNCRFSKLGDYFGKARPYDKSIRTNNRKTFGFRFVTSKEVLHHLRTLILLSRLDSQRYPLWLSKMAKMIECTPSPICSMLFKRRKISQWP